MTTENTSDALKDAAKGRIVAISERLAAIPAEVKNAQAAAVEAGKFLRKEATALKAEERKLRLAHFPETVVKRVVKPRAPKPPVAATA